MATATTSIKNVEAETLGMSPSSTNYWKGKKILWLGTSIPAGGVGDNYPTIVGQILGVGLLTNNALGASAARISQKDGSYVGWNWQAVLNSLGHTLAEKETIISNWNTIYPTLSGTPPTNINSEIWSGWTYAQFTRDASFEKRLVAQLTNASTRPDLIILDHGYNDYQYSFSGSTDDTTGDFTDIPATRDDRRYFLGAMNYFINRILELYPKTRIVIGGHYENNVFPHIATAQKNLAEYWNLPIFKLWETLGWSNQVITSTGISVKNTWLTTDGLHPAEADSKALIARNWAAFLNTIA